FYSVSLFIGSALLYHCAMNKLDHIVVAASSLKQGVEYIRETLGVTIPKGGFHQTMGTHNHLMQLGGESYLELISIDPDAAIPSHPRWFALDQLPMRDMLEQGPRLITWVMNCPHIKQLCQSIDFEIGSPTPLTRDDLSWEIALPQDGRLLAGGMLPYCIQWHSSPHPSHHMSQQYCRLKTLHLHHNRPQWLQQKLDLMGATQLVKVEALDEDEAPYLSASIETPQGATITLT
ncbi:MAG: VOC family protein, partial [Pseudomonadota bacterium]